MYYWFHSVLFAPPPWLSPITTRVTDSPLGMTTLTWGAIVLEVALGLTLLIPRRPQASLLSLGLLPHDCIHDGPVPPLSPWRATLAVWRKTRLPESGQGE